MTDHGMARQDARAYSNAQQVSVWAALLRDQDCMQPGRTIWKPLPGWRVPWVVQWRTTCRLVWSKYAG